MMFTVVFMAFTLMAYIIYNTDLETFSSFVRSMETLFSAMLSKQLHLTLRLNQKKFISILVFPDFIIWQDQQIRYDMLSLTVTVNWFEISAKGLFYTTQLLVLNDLFWHIDIRQNK